MTRVPDDVGVLQFDLTEADSVSSSSSESAVPLRRLRHGNRFSVFSEDSGDGDGSFINEDCQLRVVVVQNVPHQFGKTSRASGVVFPVRVPRQTMLEMMSPTHFCQF